MYDSSKEWVCSLYILRVFETQRIEADRVLARRTEGNRVLDNRHGNCCILIKHRK